jgi:tetratricopeptide (TPR) repeat protein
MTTERRSRALEVQEHVKDLMSEHRWTDVLAFLANETELVATDGGIAWSRGWTLFKMDRLPEAAQQLQAACSLDPDNPIRPWALGVVQREMKDYALAEYNLQRALTLKDSALARLNLAILYMEMGRPMDAEEIHREGVRLRPDHRERVEALADFLSDTGRREEAEVLYEQAKQLPSPEDRRKARAEKR